MAARAGASYVSPFLGRLDDIGENGLILLQDICDIFSVHEIETKVIAASIRNPVHVTESAKIGADFATIPFGVMKQLCKHPLTDAGIAKFMADWNQLLHKEIRLIGSNASAGAWSEAVRLAARMLLPLERLISHRIPTERFADGFELMRSHDSNVVKAVLQWK
jgi:hypothetical protein